MKSNLKKNKNFQNIWALAVLVKHLPEREILRSPKPVKENNRHERFGNKLHQMSSRLRSCKVWNNNSVARQASTFVNSMC